MTASDAPNLPAAEALLPTSTSGGAWIPVRIGESGDAVFRRADGTVFAKIARGRRIAELEGERRRVEWLSGAELSCSRVIDWHEAEEGACLVMTAVPGVPASELSPSALLGAWPSMARRLRDLHDLPAGGCPFDRSLAGMFSRAADVVARGAVNAAFLDDTQQSVPPSDLLALLEGELSYRLAQERVDLVVCHGDACLPNFMIDADSLTCTGFVDLGRLGVADRHADLALLLGNARETWLTADEADLALRLLCDAYGLDADRGRLDFYLRLDPLTWG